MHYVRNVGNDYLKCKLQILKDLKHWKSYIHCVRQFGNDDLK